MLAGLLWRLKIILLKQLLVFHGAEHGNIKGNVFNENNLIKRR
jgi:hypothetical protein